MNRSAVELLRISGQLEKLGLAVFSEKLDEIAEELIKEGEMTPVVSEQPQIQCDPVMLPDVDAKKEFEKDIREKKKKKRKPGIVHGKDVIFTKRRDKK